MIVGALASLSVAGIKTVDNIVKKVGVEGTDEYVFGLSFRSIAFVLFFSYLAATGGLFIPPAETYWLSLFASVVLYTIHTVLLIRGYKHADVGVVSSLLALAPVVVTLPAWVLLNETPTLLGASGIVLCSIGAYSLNIADMSASEPLAPARKLLHDRGARYVLADLLLISVLPSLDKLGLQHSSPLLWVSSTHAGITIAMALLIGRRSPDWTSQIREHKKILLTGGVLHTGIWVAQVYAYSFIQVAYVVAIKQLNLVATILVSHYYLDEQRLRSRLFGGLLILAGVCVVILGG